MYSIYHFFASLIRNSDFFRSVEELDKFPFDIELLSCQNDGVFPDLAIRVNSDDSLFSGGELIELKDSRAYSIASFNSTIPTGKKDIRQIILNENSRIYRLMQAAGDDVFSLLERDVFYLIRGRKGDHLKVCLVHGSFFETIKAETLIQQAFSQVLEERMRESESELEDSVKALLLRIFSEQSSFSKVRDVANASVKLRFRVMTEAKAEGNILNSRKYPEIQDDTLSLVLPAATDSSETQEKLRVASVLSPAEYSALRIFKVKHLLNGYFLVFQTQIR